MSRLIGENLKMNIFLLFFKLSAFADLALKFCNHNISKTIIARSFKLFQLIEDDE